MSIKLGNNKIRREAKRGRRLKATISQLRGGPIIYKNRANKEHRRQRIPDLSIHPFDKRFELEYVRRVEHIIGLLRMNVVDVKWAVSSVQKHQQDMA